MCDKSKGKADGSMHVGLLDLPTEMFGFIEILRAILATRLGIIDETQLATTDVAEAWYGRGTGLEITAAILDLISVLRSARRSAFQFSNPACTACREMVTRHELALVNIIMYTMSGRAAAARAQAFILCEGSQEGFVLREAKRVGTLIGATKLAGLKHAGAQ